MDSMNSSDSEKTNGNNNRTVSETPDEEFGQVINVTSSNPFNVNLESTIDIREPNSESIFSQETPEFDVEPKKSDAIVISSETSTTKSSDVSHVAQPVELVILETDTDSTSDRGSVVVIPESEDKTEHRPLRRKSSKMSPVPCKRTCLEETRQSESSTNIESGASTQPEARALTPIPGTSNAAAVRSSPRNSPKRNIQNLYKPARRLKKSTSIDVDINTSTDQPSTKSPSNKNSKLTLRRKRAASVDTKQPAVANFESNNLTQDELAGYIGSQSTLSQNISRNFGDVISGRKNPINPIAEEPNKNDDSQNMSTDSQSIKLFLSQSVESQHLMLSEGIENEPLLSQEIDNPNDSQKVVLLSESNHTSGDVSNGDIHKESHQHSNNSVHLDSPYDLNLPEKHILKTKPYLSNGYSSSTPETDPQDTHLKKSFHLSDSETDNTPPYLNFSKKQNGESKMSISSKSNSINSSISPLNNGHSNGSHINSSNPTVPTFHIQMYGDENDDFLSMFIVKTTTDIGVQTLKEYQRLSKRLSIDPYAGDVSKNTSPSSVTSGGFLQLPTHTRSSFMSTVSSSSTSSSRTSDGAFIIPQRPKKNLSFHTPSSVKGWHALKQSICEIITKLSDFDPSEEPIQSPVNGDCKMDQIQTFNVEKNQSSAESNISKGSRNDEHRSTPKSSKKKIQTKTKRVLSSKIKKNDLSITNEESHEVIESISSPEMIPTDRCEQFQTPTTLRTNDEFSNSAKSTPKGRKARNGSALNLSSLKENLQTVSNREESYSIGTLVLAKWTDKKYYSGKVIGLSDNCKYEIQFYDGRKKTLLDDFIIFGNMHELPLKGQSVYSKVDDSTYEPSLVLAVEKTETGEIIYKCTTDRNSTVSVTASDIYLTEDQAKSFHDSIPKSPHSAPGTPRRRINRDLDLNNIIHEPRSARLREKGTPKGNLQSPASPKAGPSNMRRGGGKPQRRLESESSEGGDSRASSAALEDVDGVQPETQTTPRKTRGIKVNYVTKNLIAIKGASKQKTGKESKIKFETEEEITETLGPIPAEGSTFFAGLHFLLTCTDMPVARDVTRNVQSLSDSDSNMESSSKEDELMLARIPFIKKRLEEQLQKAGGTVYNRFEDIPKSKYSSSRLIVPRPCLTGKFIMCLAANIKALCHLWVIESCKTKKLAEYPPFILPTGFSFERERMISLDERNTSKPFKDKLILVCCDNENFTKFWDRVCSLAGANTKIITEDDMDLRNSIAIVTESNCPTKIRNKAEYESVPLASTTWVVQCLIEGKLLNISSNVRYRFDYIDT